MCNEQAELFDVFGRIASFLGKQQQQQGFSTPCALRPPKPLSMWHMLRALLAVLPVGVSCQAVSWLQQCIKKADLQAQSFG